MRDTFIFYRSFMEAFDSLKSEEAGIMYKAVVHYALNGEEPQLQGYLDSMWKLILPIVKRDRILYENGTKGGRPKNQSETKRKPNGNQTETKAKPTLSNDKDKDKDVDKDIDKDEDMDVDVDVDVKKEDTTVSSKKRFVKPTYQQVLDYCTERGNGIDPTTFIDFYEARGWMIGKQHMKDWRAAVRTWEHKRREEQREEEARDPNLPNPKEWQGLKQYIAAHGGRLNLDPHDYMRIKAMCCQNNDHIKAVIAELCNRAPVADSLKEADIILESIYHPES